MRKNVFGCLRYFSVQSDLHQLSKVGSIGKWISVQLEGFSTTSQIDLSLKEHSRAVFWPDSWFDHWTVSCKRNLQQKYSHLQGAYLKLWNHSVIHFQSKIFSLRTRVSPCRVHENEIIVSHSKTLFFCVTVNCFELGFREARINHFSRPRKGSSRVLHWLG